MARLLMYSLLGICIHARPFSQRTKGGTSISGETRVEEKTTGVVRVSELSEGDVIFGIIGPQRRPAWCKVISVCSTAADLDTNKITNDGFKTDHVVTDHTVHPYKKGDKRMGLVYTLVTDCDASVNSAGRAFSPISHSFCLRELTWSEYIILMSAMRRVTNHTGYFWLYTSGYYDNDTRKVPDWFHKLHGEICHERFLCARHGQCKMFEILMKTFAHEHRNKGYVERFFSNMNSDVEKQERGSITDVAGPHGGNHTVPLSAVGSAIGVLLVLAVIIVMCGVRIMEEKGKQGKEPFSNEQ